MIKKAFAQARQRRGPEHGWAQRQRAKKCSGRAHTPGGGASTARSAGRRPCRRASSGGSERRARQSSRHRGAPRPFGSSPLDEPDQGPGTKPTGDGDLCRNAMQTARMTGLWLALGSSVVAFDGLVGWRCFQPLPRCVPRPDARPSISFHGCRRHPSRFLLRLTHRRRSPTVLRARRECF